MSILLLIVQFLYDVSLYRRRSPVVFVYGGKALAPYHSTFSYECLFLSSTDPGNSDLRVRVGGQLQTSTIVVLPTRAPLLKHKT